MHEEELILNKFPGTPVPTQCVIRMVRKGKARGVKIETREKMDNEVKSRNGRGLDEKEEKLNSIKGKCNKCDEEFEDGSELEKHLKKRHRVV